VTLVAGRATAPQLEESFQFRLRYP
jgi:hypothetical protein